MDKPRLQIVRGLPGSGKSTYARKTWPHILQYEFDFYCMRGGKYSWGELRNSEGQKWLSDVVLKALNLGIDLVVTGVFAGKSENLVRLVRAAIELGYDVWIKTMDSDHGNVHGVREKDIEEMKKDFVSTADLYATLGRYVRFGSMPSDFEIDPLEEDRQ